MNMSYPRAAISRKRLSHKPSVALSAESVGRPSLENRKRRNPWTGEFYRSLPYMQWISNASDVTLTGYENDLLSVLESTMLNQHY